jgi:L-threonylcarbamoyladenylate synthase
MFGTGEIWAYPTDTSFGLGVRADDIAGLKNLQKLKKRSSEKYFSLMVRDMEMLREFARVPADFSDNFLTEKPRTVILQPTGKLPKTGFWPSDKVAFRVCTLPGVAAEIDFPVTATSANFSGEAPIYLVNELRDQFGKLINIFDQEKELPKVQPSEIWDFTELQVQQIR